MIIAIAPIVSPRPVLAVATTWTAEMNVTDGPNMNTPTANAVAGLGLADSRWMRFGFLGFPGSRGLGFRRYRTTAAISAITPRPSRTPYLV
ncbi:MAG TPA: hypothetical protein VN767_11665 [Streptosporangiaceae bacterium]|jgi:hypothetical protein|nr:hypothetical protein [Streptosporangiaceae bacterium]